VQLDVGLEPIHGGDALAVLDAADRSDLWIAHVDSHGVAGRPIALGEGHFVGAYSVAGDGLDVVTTRGREVCRTHVTTDTAQDRSCAKVDASLVLRVGERFASILVAPPEPDDDDAASPPKRATKPTRKSKRRRKRDEHKMSSEAAKRMLLSSGRKLVVTAQWLDAAMAPEGDAIDTDLSFDEAMAGMGLIGGAVRGDRVDLAFYEKGNPKGRDAQAKIGVAKLVGDTLELDPGSKKSFGESKLDIGFIEGHQELRLWNSDRGSLVLGTRGLRGRCDVAISAPFVMQLIPDEDTCGVDPGALLAFGQAKRKGTAVPILRVPDGLDVSAVRRAPGQASWDVGRTVESSGHVYGLAGENVVVFSRDDAPLVRAAWPMRAERSRIRWGAIDVSGAGVAATDAGLVAVDEGGRVAPLSGVDARFVDGPDRPRTGERDRMAAVRIGTSWVSARGALGPLGAAVSSSTPDLWDGSAIVVGGEHEGLLIERHANVLVVTTLDARGTRGATHVLASPVGLGFDAVPRRAGGALVVGPSLKDASKFVAFALRADGAATPAKVVGLHSDRASVHVVALPDGGAVALDAARTEVAWIDDDATPLASALYPTGASIAACVDGRPLPSHAPAPTPGRFVNVEEASAPGSCVTGDLVWTKQGSLRWFGSTVLGLHSRAEIVDVPSALQPTSPPPTKPTASFTASTTRASRRCPSEMVFVPPTLCVDRFESTLADMTTGRLLSPYYAATPNLMTIGRNDFATRRERTGDLFARALPLPELSEWQWTATLSPIALPLRGSQPNGYVTGLVARASCEAAGKRLCKLDEWRRACKGAAAAQFPYGPSYREALCNVATREHPAALLHDNASVGHLDPRLDALTYDRAPRPFPAGELATCASSWGDDAIYDMVGNVDEWVDEKGGAFAGGFFARGTTNGCDAIVTAHPENYLDYSTGVRCCSDAVSQ